MEKVAFNSNEGIKIYNLFGNIEVIFPYQWVDSFIDHYCLNLDQKECGDFYRGIQDKDIFKFAETECVVRQGLHSMGNWESWMRMDDAPSDKVKLDRVSYRVEKSFRMGIGSLAITAVNHGFPCDTALGNNEDNQLYAYIVSKLRNHKIIS